jgi:hypothetical protein
MSHTFTNHTHSVADDTSFTKLQRLLIWLLLVSITALSLSEAALGKGIQQTRRRVRPRVVSQRPPAAPQSTPADIDISSPDDPAIVAESQKLRARELDEQRRTESELLAKSESAQTRSHDLWLGYRKAFLFHSQVLALSDAEPDGSRTLIISEPPPHVTLGGILATIGGPLLLNHTVEKQPIGFDGWVKDVVVAVSGKQEELQAMLSRLNQRLFFTSYKSYTLKLPVTLSPQSFDLNLTVTPEEIKRWVADENEQLFPVEGGKAETLTTLAAERKSGVYVGRRRGLVGWWIPSGRNLYECKVPARQFAIDSDLIVGAIATPSGTFVLGRERVVPVEILPPLRFETLALLADVQDGQMGRLAQSYERRHAFAGRVEEGNDWAPILLSPQLRDTEYGSLLNITDQLLKGWSNKGETKYRNFPYPAPQGYPFSKPLWKELSAKTLTYNWNTKGAGYAVDFGGLTVMALNRSGSLPVSYIPEGLGRADAMVVKAEDTGYDYFSHLNDPNLVRVVQYAGMYQVFSAFNVTRSAKPVPADDYPDQLLESMTGELNGELRQSSDAELSKLAEQLMPAVLREYDDVIANAMEEETGKLKEEIDAELQKRGYRQGSREYKEKFEYVLAETTKAMAQEIKGAMSKDINEQFGMFKLDLPAKDALGESLRKLVLSEFAQLRRMPQRYAEAIDLRAKSWIHTPVVVISWNKGSDAVGGHNLDARISKIKSDERIAPGQVGIDAEGDLVVNPTDIPRARSLARNVERNELIRELALAARDSNQPKFNAVQAEIRDALRNVEAAPARPRETALNLSSAPPIKPPVNKPPMSTGEPDAAGGAGWGGGGRSAIPVASDRHDSNVVRITQRGDNRFNVEYTLPGGKEVLGLTAMTHEDAVDVAVIEAARRAKPGEPVVVRFDEMQEQRAWATLRTMQIRMGEQDEPVQLVGLITGNEGAALSDYQVLSQYDFRRADVAFSEVQTLQSGELRQEVSLDVPAADGSGSKLSFFSELRFSKWTPGSVIEAVKVRVVGAFKGIARRWSRMSADRAYRADVKAYHHDLAVAVKKVKARTKLDFDVKTKLDVKSPSGEIKGLRDIYIGREERDARRTPGFEARQAE